MLKMLAILAFSLFIFPVQANPQTNKTKQATQNDKPSSPVTFIVEQHNDSPALEPEHQKHVQADVRVISTPSKDRYDKAALAVSFAVALIALFGVIYAKKTLKAIEGQLGEIKAASRQTDQMIEHAGKQADAQMNADRAWILIRRIGNPPDRLHSTDANLIPGIVFNFEVCGKTPAKLTDGNFRIAIFPRKGYSIPPIPDLPDSPDYSSPANSPFLAEVGTVLPVGEPINVSVTYKSSISHTEITEMMQFKNFLCAYGFIEYEDVFGRKARTDVGYIYDFATGVEFKSPDGTVLNPPGFRKGGPKGYNKTT